MSDINEAVGYIKSGKVIAYPTETIWGLGADASNEKALKRIFAIKGRDFAMPISILVRDIPMAEKFVEISNRTRELMQIVWPGPLTIVLPKKTQVSSLLTAGTDYLGLRCSDHPWVSELMWELDEPITTTSANLSGQKPATSQEELDWLPKDVLVVDAVSQQNQSLTGSTVLKILPDGGYQILRSGDFPEKELLKILEFLGMSALQTPQP